MSFVAPQSPGSFPLPLPVLTRFVLAILLFSLLAPAYGGIN